MKKRRIYNTLWLLLLLPLFSGCNDTDDVAAIFTGKTWKLNYITVDGEHEMVDFWGADAKQREESYKELNKEGTYNVVFEGIPEGEMINGNIRGTLIKNNNFEGTWSANGKTNSFRANVTGSDSGDILAKNFLAGLNCPNSTYEGDSNGNLYIIYKPQGGQRTFRIVFRMLNRK